MGKVIKDTLHANGIDIGIYTTDFENDYISLTDIARYRSSDPRITIHTWLRGRDIVEFLGLWESLHNPDFKRSEFEMFKKMVEINVTRIGSQLTLLTEKDMLLYEKETGKIINACLNVFNELGNGFLEAVYQEALAIEFEIQGIPYKREQKLEITYRGRKLNKEYYADFICFDSIIVELKTVSTLVSAHKAQVINYLKATKMKVGLLINFGGASLKWERISNFDDKQ